MAYLVGPFDAANTQLAGVVLVAVSLVAVCIVAAVRAFRAARDVATLLLAFVALVGAAAIVPLTVVMSVVVRT